MAKGARASTIKANNQKLKAKVFGPVENARTERLSAKLLELASQPKPKPDVAMEEDDTAKGANADPTSEQMHTDGMEVDQDPKKSTTKPSKGRITKKIRHKSNRKASIVFPKFKDGKGAGRSKRRK